MRGIFNNSDSYTFQLWCLIYLKWYHISQNKIYCTILLGYRVDRRECCCSVHAQLRYFVHKKRMKDFTYTIIQFIDLQCTLTKIHWDILNDYIANVFIILVFAKNSLNNRHQYWRVYIIFFIQNSCQPIFEFSPLKEL